MNPYSALADTDEPIDPTDVEFFKFTGLVPDVRVAVQEGTYDPSKYPASVSLIACSSRHGYVAAVTTEGFTVTSTKSLRQTFLKASKGSNVPLEGDKIAVSLAKAIRQIRFSAEEDRLLLATEGAELLVYTLEDIKTNKAQVQPIHTFKLDHEISDLRPNPEALPDLAAVLLENSQCKIIDLTNGSTQCEIPTDNITSTCWSPKGKQIVCGKLDGGLEHFDMTGSRKDTLSIPKAMSAGQGEEEHDRFVRDVLWIETHIFLVLYARPRASDEDDYINDGYIINRKPSTGSEPHYMRLAEITPIFTTEGRGNHFYMEVIRNFGKEIQHLVILVNAASSELSVVGQDEDGEWSTWQLPENGMVRFPLSETSSMDTYPLGLALDLTADEKLPPFDSSESEAGVEPVPILYYINDEGHIGAYHCYNVEVARRGESFKNSIATSVTVTPTSSVSPATSGFSSFVAVSAPSNDSSFADLLSGKNATSPPASSASGFGSFGSFGAASGSSVPSFAKLGSAPKVPTGFGAKPAAAISATPAFGSTTSFGSFAISNKSAAPSTFDKPLSTFGSTSSSEKKEQLVPETKPATSLFTSTKPAEIPQSSSGLFGSTSTLGSGFGSLSKNTVPGAKSPSTITPAFGSSSTVGGGFGSFGKPVASAPTTTAFGSTSSLGGSSFGSLAKNTVANAASPSAVPAFGSTSALGTSTSSKNAAPATTPTFGSSSTLGSGFGSLAKNTVPGAMAPKTSSFGSSSTLGGTSFGSSTATNAVKSDIISEPSAFAKPATPVESPKSTPEPVITPKPTPAKPVTTTITPPTPSSASVPASTTKTSSTETLVKEKLKASAADGMAKEFEGFYIETDEQTEQLKECQTKLADLMKKNNAILESKSKESLNHHEVAWNLRDIQQFGVIADDIIEDINSNYPITEALSKTIEILSDDVQNLMDKKTEIERLLLNEVDSDVVDIMDNREMDAEAKIKLQTLESQSESCGNILSDLEFKVLENRKRNKIGNDHRTGTLSLYSLHRAVRDIERDMTRKNYDICQLEEKLANIKLNDSKRRARHSSVGFTCGDISESEEEGLQINISAIEHTTRYLRRYNFLDTVCNETSSRGPLEAKAK